MSIAESQEILEEYQRVTSQQVISEIEKLLMTDTVKTGVSSLATGLPSLLSLRGLGKEIWKGTDVNQYVKKLRDEWKD